MPRGDGTGPMGMGPMSGRAAGLCLGAGRGFGRRRGAGGCGQGGGYGWRNQWVATGLPGWARNGVAPAAPDREQQLRAIKDQANVFENALEQLRKQIEEMETVQAGA